MATIKTVMKVKRWKTDDGILWAENDFLKMAYVITEFPNKIGSLGTHNGYFVEYISAQQSRSWDGCECRQS